MVRQGYIYPVQTGKILNRCPIVYTNRDYIYYVYNGNTLLHHISKNSYQLLTVEEYYNTRDNHPEEFYNSTYFVFVKNSERLEYKDELASCCDQIQLVQDTLNFCKRSIEFDTKRLESYKNEIKKENQKIIKLNETLKTLNEQKSQLIAKRDKDKIFLKTT